MSKYIGATVVNLSVDTVDVTGDITATDSTPEVIIVNDTHEDTDGGREGKVTFKGQQSGGEETTLAQIQASHDGTSDDEKGDLIFKTNDGSDGASPTERMRIDSAGLVTITRADNGNQLQLISTDADADSGPSLELYRNSSSPADDDVLGEIKFHGENDADEQIQYGLISAKLQDASDGTEDVRLSFKTITEGTERERITIQPTEVVINEDSQDLDFRVEGDSNTTALFVQGSDNRVGIGVGDPDAALDVSKGTNALGIIRATQRLTGAAAYGLDIGLDPSTGDPVFSRIVNDTVTEAYRIVRATGQVLIGTTTWVDSGTKSGLSVKGGGGGPYVLLVRNDDTGGGANLVKFSDGSDDIIGTIVGNATSNTVTYGTTSDYRVKENVTDVENAINKIKSLSPKTYNFTTDPDKNKEDGFLAHELAAVVPNAVTGEKDAMTEAILYGSDEELPDGKKVGDVKVESRIDPQQVDYGRLTPILTAALQEAIAKIETLETKVAALEGE